MIKENIQQKARGKVVSLWSELSSFLLRAGENFTLRNYLLNIFLPLAIFGILVALVLELLVFSRFQVSGILKGLPYLLPPTCIFIALYYPFYYISSRAHNINSHLPLFITYLATLATAGLDKKTLFTRASEKKEFGVLAEEAEKIVKLADAWNLGFVRACRAVAKTTPSVILQDFLERLAHSSQSGENVREFLRKEVDGVMDEYERMYKRSLYFIDKISNLYLNMIVTVALVASFAMIFPLMTDMEANNALYGVLFLFLILDLVMFLMIRRTVPKDDLMHNLNIKAKNMLLLERAFIPSLLLSFAILIILLFLRPFSTPVNVAISQTPLISIGLLAGRVEGNVMRKDDNFPTFIRTVGASAGVRGGSLTPVIGAMRNHNYGALTRDIRSLYRRLTLGKVDLSWRFFAGETGSQLVDKFSRIFIESAYSGGDTSSIGETLSNSYSRILALRKSRRQMAGNVKGMLYSSMVGMSISIFVVVALVSSLGNVLFGGGTISMEGLEFMPLNTANIQMDMSVAIILMWVLLLLHSILSSLIIKTVDSGHIFNSLTHYIVMMWVGTAITVFAPDIFRQFIPL